MTQKEICGVAYEQMKLFVKPHVYLWLSDDDFKQCHEVEARSVTDADGDQAIGIFLTSWAGGMLVPDFNPN